MLTHWFDAYTGPVDACSAASFQVRAVAGSVNGPLLEAVAEATDFKDLETIESFRSGGHFLGKLSHATPYEPKEFKGHASIAELRAQRHDSNMQLLQNRFVEPCQRSAPYAALCFAGGKTRIRKA